MALVWVLVGPWISGGIRISIYPRTDIREALSRIRISVIKHPDISADIRGYPNISADIRFYPFLSVVIRFYPWLSVVIRTYPYIYPWIKKIFRARYNIIFFITI